MRALRGAHPLTIPLPAPGAPPMESPVDWFYSDQGRQVGPVTDSALENLVRSGRITERTLVWRAGMSQWQPLREARPSTQTTLPLAPPGFQPPPNIESGVCIECQREYPQTEMIFLNRNWVCASCKPIFVQRLKEGAAPPAGNVWRHEREFVLAKGTEMPDRCVKCNAPALGNRLKRRFYWHHAAFYLLLLVMPIIYLLLAIFITKRATVEIGVCERHRRQRWWTITASWLAVLLGLAMFAGTIMSDKPVGFFPAALMLVIAIFGAMRATLIIPSRIDDDCIWLRGAGPQFLESLPEWTGPYTP